MIYSEKSRFVDEIDPKYIDMPHKMLQARMSDPWVVKAKPKPISKTTNANPVNTAHPQPAATTKHLNLKKIADVPANPSNFTASEIEDIRVGMTVEHQRFGRGRVMNIEGNGPNKKTTVLFEGVGEKQLLLQYAKLKIVN